jgi:PIN domain nuclease of toxin-antitoxin system
LIADAYILDASAVLALIYNEPGADRVADALLTASISAVNVAEAGAILRRTGHTLDEIHSQLGALELTIIDFDAEQAFTAVALYPATAPAGLSLGDRACLALASTMQLPVMTTDRVWANLDIGVEIIVIR